MPMTFLKNMWFIKNPGHHTQVFKFADETHLTHQKMTQVTQTVQVSQPIFNPAMQQLPLTQSCINVLAAVFI